MVAEKVMGWHKGNYVFSNGKAIGEDNSDWLDAEGRFMCGIAREDEHEDDEDFNLLHWHPSQSILWAWDVVERFTDVDIEKSGLNYNCYIHGYLVTADSTPLAICRAALLATIYRLE
jgi:hypothetical protein